MRQDNWKLIHYFEDGRNELYDLTTDIGEQRDLASVQSERVASMALALAVWQKERNADFPTTNPKYDAEQAAKALQKIKDNAMPGREKQSQNALRSDFSPSGGWWDKKGVATSED
jgi:hypothetical protein